MPRPLSSQTNSTGSRSPVWSHQPAVLNAAVAVAWFTDASPNEQTTMESPGQVRSATPSPLALRARRADHSMPKPTPTARGRCEPTVEVVGTMFMPGWPYTLCRPPAIGSRAEATSPRRMSRMASLPGTCPARAQ